MYVCEDDLFHQQVDLSEETGCSILLEMRPVLAKKWEGFFAVTIRLLSIPRNPPKSFCNSTESRSALLIRCSEVRNGSRRVSQCRMWKALSKSRRCGIVVVNPGNTGGGMAPSCTRAWFPRPNRIFSPTPFNKRPPGTMAGTACWVLRGDFLVNSLFAGFSRVIFCLVFSDRLPSFAGWTSIWTACFLVPGSGGWTSIRAGTK